MSNFPAQNTPIVWIDCEMTGLDLERDALVEIAVVVTDAELNPLDNGLDVVIKPPAEAVANMNDFVRNMHTKTGLIERWERGMTLAQAESECLAYIKRFVPDARKAPLGGNSVGTDRTFLARDVPALVEHLHYRVVDVSSIKELAKRWFPRTYFAAPEKTGNHQALGDIYDSIDELRYYRSILWPEGDGPSSDEAKAHAARITADLTVDRAQRAHEKLS
ncbi:oligoribonuclease [Arcanobacterium phocae]|uniref:Oligoribonuclease n=1 Tax=Arcanobacterium phocae TaxID=131112 RepID=A0A1H2LP88_9ACTO|nr:oligoribonuclease [Arcanobacterium phocae]SDU82654.1 oligoribonuclease [Arcanobacterium phocae]